MTFDTFTFFNELDILELRLNILDKHVDFFVLVESEETFSGKPKPLYFEENQERFSQWKDRIIHFIVRAKEFPDAFERAAYQKDSIRDVLAVLPADDNDTVYFGDVDEIWKPKEISDDKVYNLQQINYCYYLNNRSSENWVGTVVGKWKTLKTDTVSYWRANHTNELPDGGFHFTNMGGADQIRKKLDAYDHQEFNNDVVKDAIEDRIANGIDYVGRARDWQGKPFEMWIDDVDLPTFIRDNKKRYKKLWK